MAGKSPLSRFLRTCDRRTFLKACGALGAGVLGGGALQAAYKIVRLDGGRLQVARSRVAMGTFVTMTAVDRSRDRAEEGIGRAFEEVDRLIAILSRHDPATPLSLLNREGSLAGPPPELLHLVERSLDYHRSSGGAFDVTVKPVLDLLEAGAGPAGAGAAAERDRVDGGDPDDEGAPATGRAPATGGTPEAPDTPAIPGDDELDRALARVGSERIEIAGGGLRFRGEGMGITLDGIAKGFIVDRASHVLASHGIENHLVNAGGDIRTRGTRSDGAPWRVAIEDPRKRGRYPDVLRMTNGAVATSGSYEVYFDRERVFHHLIDPRTGRSPRYSAGVTVRAGTVMEADALSTAVFVLRPEEGLRLIDGLEGRACLLVGEDGSKRTSRAWGALGRSVG